MRPSLFRPALLGCIAWGSATLALPAAAAEPPGPGPNVTASTAPPAASEPTVATPPPASPPPASPPAASPPAATAATPTPPTISDAAPTDAAATVGPPPAAQSAQPPPPWVAAPPPTPASPPPPAPTPPRRRGVALLITGGSMFGAAYLTSTLAGAVAIDDARDAENTGETGRASAAWGRRMMIPLAGPWAAMPQARSSGVRGERPSSEWSRRPAWR